MSRELYNLAALWLAIILVGAAFAPATVTAETTSGGKTSVANAGEAPDVHIADAVIDDSAGNSEIEVAFDATGEIVANDVEIAVTGPGFYEFVSPDETEGTVNVTIPQGTFGGGNHTLTARLKNASVGEWGSVNDTDNANLTISSPVRVLDYSVSDSTVYTGENVTVTATVKNTDDTVQEFTAAVYDTTHDATNSKGSKPVTVAAGNTETVTLNVSYDHRGDREVRVNDQSTTNVSVESRVSVQDITVHDEVQPGQPVTVDVTLNNPTDRSGTKSLSYYLGSTSGLTRTSVAANSEKTVTLQQTFAEPGEKHLWIDGIQRKAYVFNDTEGVANLTVSSAYDGQTVVVGEEVYLPAEVTNHGNASGVRNVTLSVGGESVASDTVYVEQNETEYAFLSTTFGSTGSHTATIDGTHEVNVTVREQVVQSESIRHVAGTAPDSTPTVEAQFSSRGWVWVSVRNPDGGYDLADIGADDSTVFEINVTVEDYTPRVLVSSGHDLNWVVTENGDGTKTISMRVSPSQFEYMEDAPKLENWDDVENDRADFSMDAAMFIGIDNANRSDVYGTATENLTGMTIATDAQTFLPPQYSSGDGDEPPRLDIQLAGPHYTTDGDVNQGYYEAFLPDRLLDAWDVTDPDQLTAAYSESEDVNFTTTEVDGGVRVRLDLHYSSGTVSISKDDSDDSDDAYAGGTGGSAGGRVGDSDDAETSTTTETTTTETTTTETTTQTTTSETTTDATETTATNDGGTPGFGAGVAVAALAAALVAARRRA